MTASIQPQTKAAWVVDPTHTSVEFAVKHMLVSTVRGRFTKYDLAVHLDEQHPERSRVEARIDAASIDTREAQRDAHLRSPDFLEAERHPYLTFTSKRIEKVGQDRYRVTGNLTIRGVTREVVLATTYGGIIKNPWGKEVAGFSAETTLSRKDYGLTWNVALEAGGFVVGDAMKINIEAELTR